MTLLRICSLFLLAAGFLLTSGFQAQASTDNYAQQARQTCQTLVAYRMGSLLDIQVTEVKPLPAAKWLVTGEVRKQTPVITFACLVAQKNNRMELEKLELYQIKQPQP